MNISDYVWKLREDDGPNRPYSWLFQPRDGDVRRPWAFIKCNATRVVWAFHERDDLSSDYTFSAEQIDTLPIEELKLLIEAQMALE